MSTKHESVKVIPIDDLTESVTAAVLKAVQTQPVFAKFPPRIICGIIYEPQISPGSEE
jgi:hypothetical protein